MLNVFSIALACCALVSAQFPPSPQGLKTIPSPFYQDVTVSFKETHICETTPGVRSFAGYVHLPPFILSEHGILNQSWPINTFWWFFEARGRDPKNAPLLIWIAGGPGSASTRVAMSPENTGPCLVNPDGNSTRINPWSWNENFNIIFIDQPVQVGLSYDSLQNITYDLISGNNTLLKQGDEIPEQNTTFEVGTWASTDTYKTSIGSTDGAFALWHWAQAWFQEFPEHTTSSVSIAGTGYAGKYAPAIFTFFEEQNEKIRNKTWTVKAEQYILPLNAMIIDSGCIDLPHSWFAYPEMAVNNTYGIRAVNDTTLQSMLHELNREGGCLDQAYQCGNLSLQYDPGDLGQNETLNLLCKNAAKFCDDKVQGPYADLGRSYYDITVPASLSRVPPFLEAYLQRPHVQAELGVPLNYSSYSQWVNDANRRSGDFARPGWLEKMAYLLERGVKVALMYGDRGYICPWIGGEAVSLAIPYPDSEHFHAAGYEDIRTNDSYVGGVVRQYGSLSFSRVFEAGHRVGELQPETALRIVERVIEGTDVATGKVPINAGYGVYSSKGPSDTMAIKNKVVPTDVLQVCYLLDLSGTCTDEQIAMVQNGTAVIKDYIIVDRNSTQRYPEIVVGPG